MKKYLIELCSEKIFDAIKYQDQIDQIEFCADLDADGLTPSVEEVKTLLTFFKKPIKVMIRCRPGDFEYTPLEIDIMYKQIDEFKSIGIDRFVFGAIKNNRLDIDIIEKVANYMLPSKLCVHKAIDLSSNIYEDIFLLNRIENINEILTSGGQRTAEEAIDVLKKMIECAGEKVNIIAAGKITYQNIEKLSHKIGAKIYHGKNIINHN